jgi:hypothetical protein
MEVSKLPTVTGGAIQEFAFEVTTKALFDRFDEELKLGLISDQYCFIELHPLSFFFLPLLFFSLRFFLSSLFFLSLLFNPFSLLLLSLLFLFFLQDCIQSLLQLRYLLMSFLDLPDSHLKEILLWLLMLLEGIFESFHVVVDFLREFIKVIQLRSLGFHQSMSMMRYKGQLLFNLEYPIQDRVLAIHELSFLHKRDSL